MSANDQALPPHAASAHVVKMDAGLVGAALPTLLLDVDVRPTVRRFSLLHPPAVGDYFAQAPEEQGYSALLGELLSLVESSTCPSVFLSFSHEGLELLSRSLTLRGAVRLIARKHGVRILSRAGWDAPLGGVSLEEFLSQSTLHDEAQAQVVGVPCCGVYATCLGPVRQDAVPHLPRLLYLDSETMSELSPSRGALGECCWTRVRSIAPIEILSGEFLSRMEQLWRVGTGELVRLPVSSLWQMRQAGGDPLRCLSQVLEIQRRTLAEVGTPRPLTADHWVLSPRNRMQERVLAELQSLEVECRALGGEALMLWRRLARAHYVTAIDTRRASVVRMPIDRQEFVTAAESPYEAFMNLIAALEDVRSRICRSTARSAPSEYRA